MANTASTVEGVDILLDSFVFWFHDQFSSL